MVLHVMRLDPHRALRYGTRSMVSPRRWLEHIIKLTITTSYHKPLQNKVRCIYFIFCLFYVAARAFAKELFLTYKLLTTTSIKQLSLLHPFWSPPLQMSYQLW